MSPVHLRWLLVLSIAVIGIAAYGAYLSVPRHPSVLRSVSHGRTVVTHAPVIHPNTAPVRAGRSAEADYGRAIRGNLFSAPQPPPPKPPPAPSPPPPAPVVVLPPPPDPLADAVYAGSVTMDGKTMGLIESRASREGEYVTAGGQWHGFEVISIARDQMTLSVNGTVRTITVSDALNIVPLSGGASGAKSGGGPAQPNGSPGSPPMPDGGAPQALMLNSIDVGNMEAVKAQMAGQLSELKMANDTVITIQSN